MQKPYTREELQNYDKNHPANVDFNRGATGPRGLKLADYEHPVFDGPQPRTRPVTEGPNKEKLNEENAGE